MFRLRDVGARQAKPGKQTVELLGSGGVRKALELREGIDAGLAFDIVQKAHGLISRKLSQENTARMRVQKKPFAAHKTLEVASLLYKVLILGADAINEHIRAVGKERGKFFGVKRRVQVGDFEHA